MLKTALNRAKDGEPDLIARMHMLKGDIKYVYKILDSLKSAYVIDNTQMIEIDEICNKNRKAIANSNALLGDLEAQGVKVRSLKEQLAV